MKISIFLFIALACMQSCCAQQNKTGNQSLKKDTIMEHQYGIPEMYDFVSTENGTKDVVVEQNGWIIEKWKISSGGIYHEFAPAQDFYMVGKSFYPNGMIKHRAKGLGSVYFGLLEEFDEQGNLINTVDEDKKFGKIKPKYIIEFLEKEGWFNRETGENKILKKSPIKTDGSFYRDVMDNIDITFTPAVTDNNKEIAPPKWYIRVHTRINFVITSYVIDGNTGKFTKKEEEVFKEE